MTRRRKQLLAGAAACLLLAGLYGVREHCLPWAAIWLDVGQPPQPADAVFILGGDLQTRPFVAAALFKAGLAKRVLVPRTAASPDVDAGILPPHHELTVRILVHRGVPREAIVLLGTGIQTTFDEARTLADFLQAVPDTRTLVVTNAFHTRRARWVFSSVLRERTSQVAFISAPSEEFQTETWWKNEAGFCAIVSENLKFGFYLMRYKPLPSGLTAVAVALGLALLRWRFLGRQQPGTGGEANPASGKSCNTANSASLRSRKDAKPEHRGGHEKEHGSP